MRKEQADYAKRMVTIPNVLSIFRICLIPVFVWAYCVRQDGVMTAGLLVLSGATDLLDGLIARRCNMVSDLGKILDPVADKLTQGMMMLCLITRFPLMLVPFILLVVKEAVVGLSSLVVVRKTGVVHGAVWHGKVTTTALYVMMTVHVLHPNLQPHLSSALIAGCSVMMLISLVMYLARNIRFLKQRPEGNNCEYEDKKK